ncbi:MAG TPA: LptF/LptG family permease [Terriglobales bacterium]|jgi:LPS export ABC transporter permease LptG/LPS export ABC transporter permease LptF|nr:LptF/LptG family permease [Terriglobales bacterium]
MRILTRYILGEVVSHALIGAGVFTFVLFTRDLGRILELVVRNSAPLPSVAEIFFFTVPVALTYTIPMGVLVGILIGLSRLSADSEITAMRASGLGVWTFLRVISIFVIVAWLLALGNSVYLAPRSLAALGQLQDDLKGSQASFEVQPRVFYEGFPKIILYVQDVKAISGGALWKGVFLADLTDPSAPRISLARDGQLVSQGTDTLDLHLINGSTHETDPKTPDQYQISTFQTTDIPLQVPTAQGGQEHEPTSLGEVKFSELLRAAQTGDPNTRRWNLIEYHRRLSLPTACIVLALVGIPLGLSSKKGGKSSGFVLTILLVFIYYSLSLVGVSFARQGHLSPAAGVWLADFVFLLGGVFLLWQSERRPIELTALRSWFGTSWFGSIKGSWFKGSGTAGLSQNGESARSRGQERRSSRGQRRRLFNVEFPTILDDYVLRGFVFYLAMIVAAFLLLLLVFTLFELLGDILRNQVSPLTVGEYLLNVAPYFLYTTTPLSMLLAVLVTFGLLQRTNEITAIKATGISLYRVVIPVLLASILVAGVLFLSDQLYLPYTNKRQDALRNEIKGKPAQTYLRPDRKWIFGQHSDIYYYQFFDPDRNVFAGVSVFQFDPHTFQMTHRIDADRAYWSDLTNRWVYEKGWERSLNGSAHVSDRKFDVATYSELSEPPSYFKKEIKQSSEMSYDELRRYIHDLEESGFDVVRLRVQLQKKIAYPLITLVMAVLAVPFALSAGKRSALTGVATAIGIGVVYWTINALFEAMGNLSQLPPGVAAWSPDLVFGFIGGYLILRMPT